MTIKPSLFNYRLVIGSLVLGIVVVAFFSYNSYDAFIENKVFVEQEKILLENELSEMISSYEAVDAQNEFIAKQLSNAKSKITMLLDSVKLTEPNVFIASKFKQKIETLKKDNVQLLVMLDNLESENKALKLEVKQIKSLVAVPSTENKTLSNSNTTIIEDLVAGNQLKISNIVVQGIKKITASKKVIETKNPYNTNKFNVCFTLLKNQKLEKGPKDLYIQILDSNMNVVADKGTSNFGETSLIYSAKETVSYNNEDLEICSLINKGSQSLVQGAYFVSVFYQGKKLGRTTIELK